MVLAEKVRVMFIGKHITSKRLAL